MSSMAGHNKNGFFLTKKQKRQLKERRRKKKQKLVTASADVVVEGTSLVNAAGVKNEVSASWTATEIDDRKKREGEETRPQDDDDDPPGRAVINDTVITAKEEKDEDEVKSTLKRKRPPSSDTTSTTTSRTTSSSTTTTTIYIPDDIYDNPRAVKKFRKDARRDAKRKNGASDEAVAKLKFVKESDRPTRKFPVLKELVQEQQLEQQKKKRQEETKQSSKTTAADGATTTTTTTTVDTSQYVALDCEMVGIGTDGKQSVVARASIVDWDGQCLYDRYVQVPVHVTDFRTKYSGITPAHLRRNNNKKHRPVTPAQCRQDVANLLKDKILVGHALHNDLDVLMLQHANVRDTAKYRPFQRLHHVVGHTKPKYRPRKLKDLVAERLGQTIQTGSHDSVQDATAAMALYRSVHVEWEQEIALTQKKNQSNKSSKKKRSK